MTTDKTSKVVFNHFYKLRHDLKRTLIYSFDSDRDAVGIEVNTSWQSKIHPVYAMIFSFLSEPITLADLYKEVAYFLDISEEKAEKMIVSFLEQEKPFPQITKG